MKPSLENIHKQVVDEWESKNIIGLSLDQQILLFEKAIQAVEKRALKTLSNIFLVVILERVLYQSTEKFEFLSVVTINNGISFEALSKSNQNLDPKNTIEGLRFRESPGLGRLSYFESLFSEVLQSLEKKVFSFRLKRREKESSPMLKAWGGTLRSRLKKK